MSDSAFKSAPFSGYTSREMLESISKNRPSALIKELMLEEIGRREKVAAGDVSVMFPAERLHFNTKSARN